MIKTGMYVRCPVDDEYPNEPREFLVGKVIDVNTFSDKCTVQVYDNCDIKIKGLYGIKDIYECIISKVYRSKITIGSIVKYRGKRHVVLALATFPTDDFATYYIKNQLDNTVVLVPENALEVAFTDGYISPLRQLINYEFQKPVWFVGRSIVNKALKYIDNSYYGLKVITGCKIYLKPYQVKTVMRCLQEKKCRYMIADEVGLGKTIEAASVLKIYLSDNHNKNIGIIVPDSLVGQWKTELSFKFRIYDGENQNKNILYIIPFSKLEKYSTSNKFDFVIIDEVHRLIHNQKTYNLAYYVSSKTDNIILLSATPIQKRKTEYYKLMKLINPSKYELISEEDFNKIADIQNKLVRKVFDFFGELEDFKEIIAENDNERNDETEDTFEELMEQLEEMASLVKNEVFSKMITKVKYDSEDFGEEKMRTAIAYLCENYQLEKSVVRNRRDVLHEEANERDLIDLCYDIDADWSINEYRTYQAFSEWIQSMKLNTIDFSENYRILVSSFFSSSFAFRDQLSSMEKVNVPDEIIYYADEWIKHDTQIELSIEKILQDPTEHCSRLVNIIDYIDQYAFDKKVVLFTNFEKTFEYYKRVLLSYFDISKCCFFNKNMSSDDLELNVYRFQNSKSCNIMLSDESGGEGRNFQMADFVIHIDLPWDANQIEQRIGRLDRIGREPGKKVYSVVAYSKSTLEESLFNFWNEAINIFKKSQSGLEIIMNEIDDKIVESVCDDFRYGLQGAIPQVVDYVASLEKTVKMERHFDLAPYKYTVLNNQIETAIQKYSDSETQILCDAMMGWAALTGFNAQSSDEFTVRFNSSSFSINSAIRTKIVPPDMKAVVGERMNRLRGRVIGLDSRKNIMNVDSIQGTFLRKKSIENDYLHFFAPGDAIFDSVTSNALNSYKGRCCAVQIESDVDWTGIVYSWSIKPNEKFLIENGIMPNEINLYRGFLSSEIIPVSVPIQNPENLTEKDIIPRYIASMTKDFHGTNKRCLHLGARGKKVIEWFKEVYPNETWNQLVKATHEQAKIVMRDKFAKKSKLRELKSELINQKSTNVAISEFYNFGNITDTEQRKLELIYEAFKSPDFILESVCYMRLVKK